MLFQSQEGPEDYWESVNPEGPWWSILISVKNLANQASSQDAESLEEGTRIHLEDNGEDRPIKEMEQKGGSSHVNTLWLNFSIFTGQIDMQIQNRSINFTSSEKPQSRLLKTKD